MTRAGARIGLSQPAMSNALGRLRRVVQDDLLVRTASGMELTAKADALREPLRLVLRQIERVFEGDARFDPRRVSVTFALRLSDLLAYQILPPLLAAIARAAPGVALDVVHLSPLQTVDALDRDEIHAAISMSLEHPAAIRSEPLLSDRMVCVMRGGHPLERGRLTAAAFLAARHLKVSMSPTDRRFVDDILRGMGKTRNVAMNVPHWLLVPHILRSTDLISVMPEQFAASISKGLSRKALPFPSAPFEWRLYRHKRHDGDRAVDWLCGQLRGVALDLA